MYMCTLFSKRNLRFWRLHFFWRRLYASEPWVMHHLYSALGNNLPKTPSQNHSRFSHNLKMFQYRSSSDFHETEILQNVEKLHFFWARLYFSDPGSYIICVTLLATTCKNPRSKIPPASFTILKCSSMCHFRRIRKLEISCEFP